jgi:hypothetical protein
VRDGRCGCWCWYGAVDDSSRQRSAARAFLHELCHLRKSSPKVHADPLVQPDNPPYHRLKSVCEVCSTCMTCTRSAYIRSSSSLSTCFSRAERDKSACTTANLLPMSARGGLWEVGERDRRWNCDSLILVLLAVLAVAVVVTVVGKTKRKVVYQTRTRSAVCMHRQPTAHRYAKGATRAGL